MIIEPMLAVVRWKVFLVPASIGAIVGYFKSDEIDFSRRLRAALFGAFVGLCVLGAIIVLSQAFSGRGSVE